MSVPSPYTALVLDRMIRAMDLTEPLPEIALALEEYGLGLPQVADPRDLDLCYGLSITEPSLSANAFAPIVIGKGLERSASLDPVLVNEAGELALDPFESLSSMVLQSAYVFGSIYLTSWDDTGGDHHNDVYLSLYKGGVSHDGEPLILCRDVALAVAQDWLRYGIIGPAATVAPAGAPLDGEGNPIYASLEIYRFVIDIVYYNGADARDNRYEIHYQDMRRVRGAFGFAEETLAATLVPLLVRFTDTAAGDRVKLNAAIKEVVRQWVLLPSWQPNFAAYWNSYSPVEMPDRLREYLLEELAYVV